LKILRNFFDEFFENSFDFLKISKKKLEKFFSGGFGHVLQINSLTGRFAQGFILNPSILQVHNRIFSPLTLKLSSMATFG